jgi:hypothetical protein
LNTVGDWRKCLRLCLMMTREEADAGARARASASSQMLMEDREGTAVLALVIVIAILSLVIFGAHRNMMTDLGIAVNHSGSVRAFYAAQAGAEFNFNHLWQVLSNTSTVPTFTFFPPAGLLPANAYSFGGSLIAPLGDPANPVKRPVKGDFAGLAGYVQEYRITSTAREARTRAVSTVVIDVEDQQIPLSEFGVFYNDILEILADEDLNIQGRVHANKDIYMGSDGHGLTVESKVATAGNVHNHRLDSEGGINEARIRDNAPPYSYRGLDIESENGANWSSDAEARWHGNVQSVRDGVKELSLVGSRGNPYSLLGVGEGSLYEQAGLRIVDGVAQNVRGSTVDLCSRDESYRKGDGTLRIDPGCSADKNFNAVVKAGSVYDYREDRSVPTLDVDIGALQLAAAAMAALYTPGSGGVLYIHSGETGGAVRLVEATALPQTTDAEGNRIGLTVVTDNPLYVKGSYNNGNGDDGLTVPAALLSDALTILSDGWKEGANAYGRDTPISDRGAAETWVNASVVTGNKQTDGRQYGGGVENITRFLEDWSGIAYHYRGSLACLWPSSKVRSNWPGPGTVYKAPSREWIVGASGAVPPGMPRIRVIRRSAWYTQ